MTPTRSVTVTTHTHLVRYFSYIYSKQLIFGLTHQSHRCPVFFWISFFLESCPSLDSSLGLGSRSRSSRTRLESKNVEYTTGYT